MKNIPNNIGVIHFPPLAGYKDSPGLDKALENAIEDLAAFEEGGMDGIIIENNYDLPHSITVNAETVASMTALGAQIRKLTRLRLGVCVLFNDYRASLAVANAINADFVRIPVFVDQVQTEYGIANPCADEAIAYRQKIHAEQIALLVDVHVKHSKILSEGSLEDSIKRATDSGADGIIITGKWTGDPPSEDDLKIAALASPNLPVLAGSGVNEKNISLILKQAQGVIVSTSLKKGSEQTHRQNIFDWNCRIDKQKVLNLISAASSSF